MNPGRPRRDGRLPARLQDPDFVVEMPGRRLMPDLQQCQDAINRLNLEIERTQCELNSLGTVNQGSHVEYYPDTSAHGGTEQRLDAKSHNVENRDPRIRHVSFSTNVKDSGNDHLRVKVESPGVRQGLDYQDPDGCTMDDFMTHSRCGSQETGVRGESRMPTTLFRGLSCSGRAYPEYGPLVSTPYSAYDWEQPGRRRHEQPGRRRDEQPGRWPTDERPARESQPGRERILQPGYGPPTGREPSPLGYGPQPERELPGAQPGRWSDLDPGRGPNFRGFGLGSEAGVVRPSVDYEYSFNEADSRRYQSDPNANFYRPTAQPRMQTDTWTRQEPELDFGSRSRWSRCDGRERIPSDCERTGISYMGGSFQNQDYSRPQSDFLHSAGVELNRSIINQERQAKLMYLNCIDPVKFDGSPKDFPAFVKRLEDVLGSDDVLTDNEKVEFLPKFVKGDALKKLESMRGRSYVSMVKGLREKYGHPALVARSFIDDLTSGEALKPNDREKLQDYADLLTSATESLEGEYLQQAGCMPNITKIIDRLPPPVRRDWEKKVLSIVGEKAAPDLNDVAQFVQQHSKSKNNPFYQTKADEWKSGVSGRDTRGAPGGRGRSDNLYFRALPDLELPKCVVCSEPHPVWRCPQFRGMQVAERSAVVKGKGLCFVCLRPECDAGECPRRGRLGCRSCSKPHNWMLGCPKRAKNTDNLNATSQGGGDRELELPTGSCGVESDYLMCIIPVRIRGPNETVTAYAFLDSGSRASFVDWRLAARLGLDGPEITRTLCGVSSRSSQRLREVNVTLENVDTGFAAVVSDHMYVMVDVDLRAQLESKALRKLDISKYGHLKDLCFPPADSPSVDILLGLPVVEAHEILEYYRGRPDEPYAFRTRLGVAFAGPVSGAGNETIGCRVMNVGESVADPDVGLARAVDKLLNMEDWGVRYPAVMGFSAEDQKAISIIERTLRHRADQHYECGLLWRDPDCVLPYNRATAEKRFRSLERKFAADPEYFKRYAEAMNATVENGWASPVPNPSEVGPRTFYISHFGVENPNKPGKVRPVFDLKEKTEGVSLNDCLLSGPDINSTLAGVVLRSRQAKICVASDIKGMFSQCFIAEQDRDSHRFLWYNSNGVIAEYRMNVHTFGAADSPFAANTMLQRVADDFGEEFGPDVVDAVRESFYVDDAIFSRPDAETAIAAATGLKALLEKGGFELVKFSSNDREVLRALNQSDRARPEIDLDLDTLPEERALGLKWNLETDELGFNIGVFDKPETMRGILSTTARVFDPLGYAAPAILKARLILRSCWENGLKWDEELPPKILREWVMWKNQLPSLANFTIPRPFFSTLDTCKAGGLSLELHVFCDSSQLATGFCCYLRAVSETTGEIRMSTIVLGKSKLLPRKPKMTIPRSELSAAVDAVRAGEKLKVELGLGLCAVFYWTDSKIAISYISNENRRFHVFVANRQSEIRQSTEISQWHFVPGELNPSDEASRGLDPDELTSDHRYVVGPEFLQLPVSAWPGAESVDTSLLDSDPEVKVLKVDVDSEPNPILDFLENSSSLRKVKKVLVRIQRAADAARESRKVVHSETVTVAEMERAELALVQAVQREYFSDEIAKLDSTGSVGANSEILSLTPFLGNDGTLRVGGRLRHSSTPVITTKHPAVLPSPRKCQLSRLLILGYHYDLAHGSQELILGKLRESFWIIHARSYVRSVIHNCPGCRILNARPVEQIMGEIPTDRLSIFEPCFTNTGTDLFGPVMCKERRSVLKYYGVIFLCMTTTAIHVELVKSLSTDDFMLALMRFVALRGGTKRVRSDNGSNYIGAERELRELVDAWDEERITKEMEVRGVEWTFQTPYASSQSGIWERRVKDVKRHLYGTIGASEPSPDVLRTALYEVSAVMNQVPLVPVSSDPNSYEAITPGHFLFTKPASVLAPVPTDSGHIYRSKWRQVQQISDSYWKRFVADFVPSLLPRKKWRKERRNLRIGDMVILFNPDLPRNRWTLGRVVELYPGRDGNVRNVRVKTKDGFYDRPIQKLGLISENV